MLLEGDLLKNRNGRSNIFTHTLEYCLAPILGQTHSTLEMADPSLCEKEDYLSLCLHIGLNKSCMGGYSSVL